MVLSLRMVLEFKYLGNTFELARFAQMDRF